MTKEEKAKQLYCKYRETDFARESAAFNAAMRMAEWKEEQIKSNLQNVFNCMVFRQDHSLSNKEHQYIDLDIVQNIIESFFHIKLDEYGE